MYLCRVFLSSGVGLSCKTSHFPAETHSLLVLGCFKVVLKHSAFKLGTHPPAENTHTPVHMNKTHTHTKSLSHTPKTECRHVSLRGIHSPLSLSLCRSLSLDLRFYKYDTFLKVWPLTFVHFLTPCTPTPLTPQHAFLPFTLVYTNKQNFIYPQIIHDIYMGINLFLNPIQINTVNAFVPFTIELQLMATFLINWLVL